MRYGIKSITMDDIAKHMSISKKTIYQSFKDKNELVCLVTKEHFKRERIEILSIIKNAKNSIEIILEISRCLKSHISGMNPSILYDLQKYHHMAWEEYEKFKNETVTSSLEETLRMGIEEGNFREDINPELLAILRTEHVQMAFNHQIFPNNKFNFMEVQEQFLGLFIHGILSQKGRKLFERYLNEININNNSSNQ